MRRARDRKGRFLPRGRASNPRRRRRRSNPVANPRRRRYTMPRKRHSVRAYTRRGAYVRRHMSNPYRRRRYRRNPDIRALMSRPNIETAAYTVGGMVGTPFIEGFLVRMLPAEIAGNMLGKYVVKLGAAFGASWVAELAISKRAGQAVLIGGLAYTAMGLAQDLGLFKLLGVGNAATATPSTGKYLQSQRLLGRYPAMGTYETPITAGTPNRLDPAGRF